MFDRILSYLRELPGTGNGSVNRDDPRVAAAAILYEVMNADGVRQDAEWERIKSALAELYGTGGAELDQLVEAGKEADAEAVDLYAFTSVLKRHLNEEDRIRFIRMLWEVVYADGDVHELEDNLLWRVAELIGVSAGDRVGMRKQVASRMPAADGSPLDE